MQKIAVIILAAGSSSRLGQPKQLLKINGETLLNRTIRFASEVSNEIIVVLGANFNIILPTITNKSIEIVENENWETGMSSSVIAGLGKCLDADNIIICLCDQPYLTSSIFENLIECNKSTSLPIIACSYLGQIGVPILFKSLMFNALLNLNGDKGAKSILNNHKESIVCIPFFNGEIDVDTLEDWENYNQEINKSKTQ